MNSVPSASGMRIGKNGVWRREEEAVSDELGTAPARTKPAMAKAPRRTAERVLATLSMWASTVLLASVLAAANGYGADKDSANASGNRPAAPAAIAEPPAPPAAVPTTQPPAPATGKGDDKAASLDAPGEWPQWGGPHRNGVSTEKGLYRQWPAGGPTILWRTKVGRGLGTPAVWGNEVYVVVAEGWTNDEALSCMDTVTGKEKWRIKFPTRECEGFGWAVGGPRATPAITEKHVFALGAVGTLRCVDRKTGTKAWERDLYADYMLPGKGEWKGFCGSPVVFGNTVIVHGGAFKQFCVATDKVIAKPVATNEEFAPPMSTPVCLESSIFGGSTDMLCLDARTLKTLWAESNEQAVTAFTMLIGGNGRVLVLNEEGELALLVAKAGKCELLGKMKVCGKTQSHPALADGKLFVRDAKTPYCYDLKLPEKTRADR